MRQRVLWWAKCKHRSGSTQNSEIITAASPEWPLGSRVQVTNLANHRSVTVRVNDRLPARAGHRIDLSQRAAQQLGFQQAGLVRVRVTLLG
jgi:rare lipoprotein A